MSEAETTAMIMQFVSILEDQRNVFSVGALVRLEFAVEQRRFAEQDRIRFASCGWHGDALK